MIRQKSNHVGLDNGSTLTLTTSDIFTAEGSVIPFIKVNKRSADNISTSFSKLSLLPPFLYNPQIINNTAEPLSTVKNNGFNFLPIQQFFVERQDCV
jgi:hypothetical protein